MRLPRMTTRRWMVVVAVLALLMGGGTVGYRLERRHDDFLSRAQYHADEVHFLDDQLIAASKDLRLNEAFPRILGHGAFGFVSRTHSKAIGPSVEEQRERFDFLFRSAAYHARMARKYRRAACYPWLRVEPDPPVPR